MPGRSTSNAFIPARAWEDRPSSRVPHWHYPNDDRRSPLPAGIGPQEVPREDGPLIGDRDNLDGGIAQGGELLGQRAYFVIVAR